MIHLQTAYRRDGSDIELIVDRPGPLKQSPMCGASSHIECTGEQDQLASSVPHQHGQLREPDVVADRNSNLSPASDRRTAHGE